MRLQDKGNRFVVVDKKLTLQKQTNKSRGVALSNYNKIQLMCIIAKVSDWAEKWLNMGELTKEWKKFVINTDVKPGKNSTLYKQSLFQAKRGSDYVSDAALHKALLSYGKFHKKSALFCNIGHCA